MDLRAVKLWQWAVLGAVLGLLVAFGQLLDFSEQRVGGPGFISQTEFERGLRMPPVMGRPYFRSIVVHSGAETDFVTLEQLVPETLTYRSVRFAAPRPYQPLGDSRSAKVGDSVRSFLRETAIDHPTLSWRYAWWDEPVKFCVLLTAAGALVLTAVGSMVLRLSGQSVLAEQARYDGVRVDSELPIDREKHQPDTNLELIEAELVSGQATVEEPVSTTCVAELSSEPLVPTPILSEASKQYAGAFYPVETRAPHGFSLSELVVVIGIVAILVSLLLPTVRLARLQAQTVQCATQLRQIGQALSMYSQQNRGWLPAWSGWHTWPAGSSDDSPGPAWTIEVMPYIGPPDSPVYHCPSFPGPIPCRNYFLAAQWSGQSHRNAMKLTDVTMTSRFVLSGDKTQLGLYPRPDGTSEHISDDADPDDHGDGMPVLAWPWEPGGFYMHRGGNNVLFDDMHVALFSRYDRDAMTFNPHRMENWADVTPD